MTNYVNYNGKNIPVRGGAWTDIMNVCFYTVVGQVGKYDICKENGNGELFAIIGWTCR